MDSNPQLVEIPQKDTKYNHSATELVVILETTLKI